MDLVKKVDQCELYYNIYIAGLLRGGCAEKETMMAEERWWKAPGKVVLTSTKTNTAFGLHWPEGPRAARWPRIK